MFKKIKTAFFGGKTEEKLGPNQTQVRQDSFDVHLPEQSKMEKSRVAPGFYKPIPEETLVEWTAPARPFKKRNHQFFSTILIIAILISLILFFAGQVLPVAVVIAIVFLVYVTAVIPPQDVKYKLTNYGIYVGKEAFSWATMGRFWFDNKLGQRVLEIELAQFPGRLTFVLIEGQTPKEEDLAAVLSEVLLQEKPPLTTYEKAAAWLRDKFPLE